jgi:hypothetical protein
MTMKEVKIGRKLKGQPYERSWKNNKKHEYGIWTQIQRRIVKAVRTKSLPIGKDGRGTENTPD